MLVAGRRYLFLSKESMDFLKKLNIAFRAQGMIHFLGLIQNPGVSF